MSVRRIAETQPESFEFTPDNLEWAEELIAKYPAGKERSAVIPLLWRAQEQNDGWTSEPAMRLVADMLGMAYIRVYEVATFYTMFQLSPVGKKAHVQVCGTTPCMLRGSKQLIEICKKRINKAPHKLSEDGNFSWEEVECLGACVNAPMIQIFKDTYEDLDEDSLVKLLDAFAKGEKPKPGPQISRDLSCPEGGLTSLIDVPEYVPLNLKSSETTSEDANTEADIGQAAAAKIMEAKPVIDLEKDEPSEPQAPLSDVDKAKAERMPEDEIVTDGAPVVTEAIAAEEKSTPSIDDDARPDSLENPRDGEADDLKKIKGVGPKVEATLNSLGIYHFDQIAAWTAENAQWVDAFLAFRGRIGREDWINQADILSQGFETEFSKRAKYDDKPSNKPAEGDE